MTTEMQLAVANCMLKLIDTTVGQPLGEVVVFWVHHHGYHHHGYHHHLSSPRLHWPTPIGHTEEVLATRRDVTNSYPTDRHHWGSKKQAIERGTVNQLENEQKWFLGLYLGRNRSNHVNTRVYPLWEQLENERNRCVLFLLDVHLPIMGVGRLELHPDITDIHEDANVTSKNPELKS